MEQILLEDGGNCEQSGGRYSDDKVSEIDATAWLSLRAVLTVQA